MCICIYIYIYICKYLIYKCWYVYAYIINIFYMCVCMYTYIDRWRVTIHTHIRHWNEYMLNCSRLKSVFWHFVKIWFFFGVADNQSARGPQSGVDTKSSKNCNEWMMENCFWVLACEVQSKENPCFRHFLVCYLNLCKPFFFLMHVRT